MIIEALAILATLAVLTVIVRDAVHALWPWPEPRAHHRLRCGGGCPYSCDSAETFAHHHRSMHTDETVRRWVKPDPCEVRP